MSPAGTETSPASIWLPRATPGIIAIAVSLAAFMEVLDTSIAKFLAPNVLLCHETGTLPQIRQCHAGRVIQGTLFRLAIPIQISKFRVL